MIYGPLGAAPYHAAKHSAVFRTRPLLYVRTTAVLPYMESGWVDVWMGAWVVLGEVMAGWMRLAWSTGPTGDFVVSAGPNERLSLGWGK